VYSIWKLESADVLRMERQQREEAKGEKERQKEEAAKKVGR
jgi:hypothetical protein